MLVGTNDGRVDEQMLQIGFAAQSRRKPFPDTLLAPAREANIGAVPMPQGFRQVAPRAARAHNPENRLNKAAVIPGGTAWVTFLPRQQRLNTFPLIIS